MYLWTRKSPLSFGSHPDPTSVSRLDLLWWSSDCSGPRGGVAAAAAADDDALSRWSCVSIFCAYLFYT